MSKRPFLGSTPCCQQDVNLTHRNSKLRERARNHTCSKCGKRYYVSVANGSVSFSNRGGL